MNKYGNRDQRFDLHISNDTIVFFAYFIQCLWRFARSKRSEQGLHMTIRVSGTDIILDTLGSARQRIIHMSVQNFMQLQDVVLRNRNSIKTLVNNVQHITISCNFLFITVLWCSFFFDQLPDAGACSHNAEAFI